MQTTFTPSCAIALSADVPVTQVHPIELDGVALALWRDTEGDAHVWEDRCPHRGMRLSFGFVRGTRLTCLYHGWQYGTDGTCKHIPAHPDLQPPATIGATPFAVSEALGMIFASRSAHTTPDAPLDSWYPVRSLFVDCDAHTVAGLVTASKPLVDAPFILEGAVFLAEHRGGRVALAIQSRAARKSALHLTTTIADPDQRVVLARRLVALRQKFKPGAV